MPKTVILAIFTLGLAAATLVTDFVSPYRGGPDRTVTATPPTQARSRCRRPRRSARYASRSSSEPKSTQFRTRPVRHYRPLPRGRFLNPHPTSHGPLCGPFFYQQRPESALL